MTDHFLRRYADHIGIHYVLCSKLRQFPYEDIEFFLPQLCHLVISVDNESMALEEFLLDLCEESVTAALLVCLNHPLRRRLLTNVTISRLSGYSKLTCMISHLIHKPMPSKLAAASIIRSNTSSLDSPTMPGTRKLPRISSP